MDSCSGRRVIQERRPHGEEWVSVPDTGNVEAGVASSEVFIAHLLEINPENRTIMEAGRRALGAEMAKEHVGDIVV